MFARQANEVIGLDYKEKYKLLIEEWDKINSNESDVEFSIEEKDRTIFDICDRFMRDVDAGKISENEFVSYDYFMGQIDSNLKKMESIIEKIKKNIE